MDPGNRFGFTQAACIVILLLALALSGCGGSAKNTGSAFDDHHKGSMELKYADQFRVDYYDDGISVVRVEDGLDYLVTDGSGELPDWLSEEDIKGMTVINAPARKVYNAASSAMDLIDAAGAIDSVVMTSTQESDWSIDRIRKLVGDGTIRYIGKYRSPDYEALVEDDVDLAIESTMIYHNPQVKEAIEELGIPVLVERSSYESEPLGRVEWIKLYGLLFGKEDEAQAFFDESEAKLKAIDTDAVKDSPSVAFFSVNSNGSVVVRKPGDYVTKMMETAGGTYALDGITDDEDNALSTMNMQMEAFYDKAVDADILIYNSTIEGGLGSISDLTALSDGFNDFAAVKNGNVWCTDASTFQKTTGAADMITEMNRIFAGAADDSGMEYFHKLR
ncbi:MAG: ABC transporter substrate-binding protein [Mogibacterium sp.]|nr:ABC transporter substrate-binding protein [Mogibacterium sp.]